LHYSCPWSRILAHGQEFIVFGSNYSLPLAYQQCSLLQAKRCNYTFYYYREKPKSDDCRNSFEKLWAMGINPMYAYFGMLIVYVFVTQGLGISRMRRMNLPAAYMKSVYQSAALQVIGILSIAVGLVMYL
jgi:hypothetical protein